MSIYTGSFLIMKASTSNPRSANKKVVASTLENIRLLRLFMLLLTILFLQFFFTLNAFALTATFSWLPNPETNIAGYEIHHGTETLTYDTVTDIGNPAPVDGRIYGEVPNLIEGVTYYFTAIAYDTEDNTGEFSTEIVWMATAPASEPPQSSDANITTLEDQSLSGQVNATSGLPLTFSLVDNVSSGTLTFDSDGSFNYVPDPNMNGSDSFTFTATDDNGTSAIATVDITITAVNDAPVANSQTITVTEDIPFNGTLTGTDQEGTGLTYALVSDGSKGTCVIDTNGTFVYTPGHNSNGSDSFSFRVRDGQLYSTPAIVNVNISAVNDTPVAVNQSITVTEDTPFNGTLTATDPEGTNLTYGLVATSLKGEVSFGGSGSFTYTPATNATGADSFAFNASDGENHSNTATVSITITNLNDRPVANSGSISVTEDIIFSGSLSAVDPDGDPLSYSLVTNGAKGSVTVDTNGSYSYTPQTNYNGNDSFSFRVKDASLFSQTAVISIAVAPVNDPPRAENSSLSIQQDTSITSHLIATDPDQDSLVFTLVKQPDKGEINLNHQTGGFTYNANASATGGDTVTFTTSDGSLVSNTAQLTITIAEGNQVPVAQNASLATDEDTPLTGQLVATDPENDALTYTVTSEPAKGTVVIDGQSGSFSYTPGENESGSDMFSFIVSDQLQQSNVATVNITINPVNDPPTVYETIYHITQEDQSSLVLNGVDPEGETLTYAIESDPDGIVTLVNPVTGQFSLQTGALSERNYTFTFTARDATDTSNPASCQIYLADEGTLIKVLGSSPDSDHAGSVVDTSLDLDHNSYHDSQMLRIRNWSALPPNLPATTTLVQLNLHHIPASAVITGATLYLYQTRYSGPATGASASIHRIRDISPIPAQSNGYQAADNIPWTSVLPGVTSMDVPLGLANVDNAIGAVPLSAENRYRSWDIINLIQAWQDDGNTFNGVLIRTGVSSEVVEADFASSENALPFLRPKVVISYRIKPPTPQLLQMQEVE